MFTKRDIEAYFIAEKQESLLFLVIGMVALGLAGYFYFIQKSPVYKGLAIPLLVIGIIQVVVGFTVYTRSDRQRIENVYAYDMSPSKLQQEELVRMKTVNKNFQVYKWLEIGCLAAGVLLVILNCKATNRQFLLGIGVGLLIEAVFMLGADYFAAKRAIRYTNGIEEFLQIR